MSGDEAWQHVTAGRGRSWLVVEGLSPDVVYEMRVVARAERADSDDSATYSDVQRVRLGVKRGRLVSLTHPLSGRIIITTFT